MAPRARRIVILVVAATLVFGAALGGFLFWYLGSEGDAVRKASKQFAAAVQDNDPEAAPAGTDKYVTGIRDTFGPVKTAEVVHSRKKSVYRSSSQSSSHHSYWVADILLRTERGAAVVELAFDDNSIDPSNAQVTLAYELEPKRIPGDALDGATRIQVESDFRTRGSKAANSFDLSGVFKKRPAVTPSLKDEPPQTMPAAPPDDEVHRQQRRAQKLLKCVQRAHGDIAKLQKCAEIR